VTYVYGGTGVLQASGAPSDELAHGDVRITRCPAVQEDAWQGVWYPGFSVLNIGDRCTIRGQWVGGTIRGQWVGGTFVAAPVDTCSLRVGGRAIDIRISDVTALTAGFGSFVEVLVGGAVANAGGGVDRVLYTFRGGVFARESAGDACRRVDLEPRPSAPAPSATKASEWEI
jgi:hypothetical protein